MPNDYPVPTDLTEQKVDGETIEFFSPECPSCGGTERSTVANPHSHSAKITGTFRYVSCGGCGLIYECPRPVVSDLGKCYAALPKSVGASGESEVRGGLRGWLLTRWRRWNGRDAALPYLGKGPILDVGCNRGELLLQLRKAGFVAEGLEFNEPAVEECRKLGFQVYCGDVSNTELPAARYGTIILAHTLEHLTDPVADLRKLSRSLAGSESSIIIVVPNADSPVRYRFGNAWHGWDPPFHICHYTAKTLAGVADRAGLKLHRYRTILIPEDYTRSLAIATGKSGRRFARRMLLLFPMKIMQIFGYGSILVAELRPATPRAGAM